MRGASSSLFITMTRLSSLFIFDDYSMISVDQCPTIRFDSDIDTQLTSFGDQIVNNLCIAVINLTADRRYNVSMVYVSGFRAHLRIWQLTDAAAQLDYSFSNWNSDYNSVPSPNSGMIH